MSMTVRLTPDKAVKLERACRLILQSTDFTLRLLAKTISLMVASFPGVQYGQLFYRRCDNFKSHVLKQKKGDFNAKTTLPPVCRKDLEWWTTHITEDKRFVVQPRPGMTIETDASGTGWGACIKGDPASASGGHWSMEER